MSFSKGLGFRLENIDGVIASENHSAEGSIEVDNDAAGAVGETAMVAEENEAMEGAIDDSTSAVEELGTEVLPAMAEAAADDGFTPREAEQVQARLESICRRAGIDFDSTGLTMRRESFGSSASRKTQTRMRLEAAEGVFKKIWENLKKAWAWIKDQIGSQWAKWTSNAESIKKRLVDIQERISKLPSGSKPDKSRLKQGAKMFSIGRKCEITTTVATIIASVKDLEKVSTGIRTALSLKNLNTFKGSDGGKAFDKNGDTAAAAEFTNELTAAFAQATSLKTDSRPTDSLSRNFKVGSDNPEIIKVLGALPGGRAFVFSEESVVSGSFTSKIQKVSLEIVEDSFAEDWEAPKTSSEISSLCTQGLDVVNVLIKSEKSKKELEIAAQAIMTYCEDNAKAATAFADSDKNSDRDALKASITIRVALVKSLQKIVTTISQQTPKMQFDTAATLADMAAAAVSNMKDDKK